MRPIEEAHQKLASVWHQRDFLVASRVWPRSNVWEQSLSLSCFTTALDLQTKLYKVADSINSLLPVKVNERYP